MKRFDKISNRELEVLFTDGAYECYKNDAVHFEDHVMVRMKHNYKNMHDRYGDVYLMRLASERNADNLVYHSEAWFNA